jgi:hypothetical protein
MNDFYQTNSLTKIPLYIAKKKSTIEEQKGPIRMYFIKKRKKNAHAQLT